MLPSNVILESSGVTQLFSAKVACEGFTCCHPIIQSIPCDIQLPSHLRLTTQFSKDIYGFLFEFFCVKFGFLFMENSLVLFKIGFGLEFFATLLAGKLLRRMLVQ